MIAPALLLLLVLPAHAATGDSPLGRWYAEGGAAQVEIESCGDEICGRIVWLRSPFDENGCALTDRWNPEASLQTRTIIGLEILHGLKPLADATDAWGDGRIYDPTSGTTYRCTMRLDGPDRLRVRGYYGIELLGRTTTWLRVGAESRTCSAAASADPGS